MASELDNSRKAWSGLIVSTLAFTGRLTGRMVFGVIGIPIRKRLKASVHQVHQRLHADVWRGPGLADLDVLDGKATRRNPAFKRSRCTSLKTTEAPAFS